MKTTTLFVTALCSVSVLAGLGHDDSMAPSRHRRLGRSSNLLPRADSKRCKARKASTTSEPPAPTPSYTPEAEPVINNSGNTSNNNANSNNNNNNNNNAENSWGPTSGVIQVSAGSCGDVGATSETTATSGPNGGIDFLNCGVDGAGWNPPYISLDALVTKPLSEALNSPSSPFQACGAYIGMFEQYGAQFGIPPIMLASFAMQESSCNPATTGGGGEAGLMQLTHDKCGDAPGGNCYDPDYNIRTGAKFFSDTLAGAGGSVLEALGRYNGWFKGMTYGAATAAANSGCCRCQNNLDYLHQFVNGWLQNINAYDSRTRLGRYFNLDVC